MNRIKNLFGEERYEEIMREHESDARSILIGKRKESDLVKTALSKLSDDFSGRRPEGSVQEDKILVAFPPPFAWLLHTDPIAFPAAMV